MKKIKQAIPDHLFSELVVYGLFIAQFTLQDNEDDLQLLYDDYNAWFEDQVDENLVYDPRYTDYSNIAIEIAIALQTLYKPILENKEVLMNFIKYDPIGEGLLISIDRYVTEYRDGN